MLGAGTPRSEVTKVSVMYHLRISSEHADRDRKYASERVVLVVLAKDSVLEKDSRFKVL